MTLLSIKQFANTTVEKKKTWIVSLLSKCWRVMCCQGVVCVCGHSPSTKSHHGPGDYNVLATIRISSFSAATAAACAILLVTSASFGTGGWPLGAAFCSP
jgi:hypothetical protein